MCSCVSRSQDGNGFILVHGTVMDAEITKTRLSIQPLLSVSFYVVKLGQGVSYLGRCSSGGPFPPHPPQNGVNVFVFL